jgi:hypothetical protein
MLRRAVYEKFTDVSVVLTAALIFLMEAVSNSDMSVNVYQTTRRNIPEDSHLQKE